MNNAAYDDKKLHAMFARDEGLRLKPYRCTAGKLSIGYGRNLDDVGISGPEAELLLDTDVARAQRACLDVFGDERWGRWSENRRLGWLNIAYNLGQTSLLGFKNTLRYANQENWPAVEAHLRGSKWFRQVGSRAERVIALIIREEWPYA